MCNFQPLEVVGRGSETQLQMGENLNKLTLAGKRLKHPGAKVTVSLFSHEAGDKPI